MNVELMLLTVLQGLRTQILDAGRLHLGRTDGGAVGLPQDAAGRLRAGGGTPRRCCSLQPHSQAAGGPHPPL